MMTVETYEIAATATQPRRIKAASVEGYSVTVAWYDSANKTENHKSAVRAWHAKYGIGLPLENVIGGPTRRGMAWLFIGWHAAELPGLRLAQ